jgi:ATP-dependent Zn protease
MAANELKLETATIMKTLTNHTNPALSEAAALLVTWAETRAKTLVTHHWRRIQRVASELVKHERLTGSEIREVLDVA